MSDQPAGTSWMVSLCSAEHPRITDASLLRQFEEFLSKPFNAKMAQGVRALKGFYDGPDWWEREKAGWGGEGRDGGESA